MDLRLLLVDDHPMLRHGLRQLVAQQPNLMVVGEASTGGLALKLAGELAPDVIVMDIHLPDMTGIEASRQILSARAEVKILIFSSDPTRSLVDEALQAGACGYILKQSAVEELLHAVDLVMAGKLYLSPEVSAGILEDYRERLREGAEPAKARLSDREKLMLRLVAEGRRNKEIAGHLGIGIKSVEVYRSRLMKKVGCASTAELVRYAIREGIVIP